MSKLKETIALTYAYYHQGRICQDAVLDMYIEDLDGLDPQTCTQAYGQWRRNPQNRTFPLPAQIRELVNPEQFVAIETQAREIASRIVGGIAKYGWCNGKEAERSIGPEGWALVQRHGGWSRLCEDVGTGYGKLNPLTLTAQLRDQLEGTLRYGMPAVEQAIGIAPREARAELSAPSHSEMIRSILSRQPPEPA